MMRFFVLVLLLMGSAQVYAAKGSIQYLPKNGGPPVELNPAIAFGQLAGRFSPIIGIATAAVQACVEAQCINMLTGKNATPPPVPGWSDPMTPPSTSPASTSTYRTCNGANQQCVTDPDPQASCDGSWQLAGAYHGVFSTGTTCTGYRNSDGAYMGVRSTVPLDFACPTGYQLSGSTCYIIAGQEGLVKWPSDGMPTFMLDANNNWIPHPNDPDTINPATGQPFTPPPSVGSLYSHDEYNNPTETTVQPTADGGTKTTQHTQGVNQTTGTTDTTTHQTTTDAAGNVVNYTYQYNANTSLSQVTQPQNLTIPNDYARENTLQGTNTKLQTIIDEMKKPPEPPPTIPDNEEGPESSEIPLPTISADGPELGSGGCPADISISALGTTITVPLAGW